MMNRLLEELVSTQIPWFPFRPKDWNIIPPKYLAIGLTGGNTTKGDVTIDNETEGYVGFSASGPDVRLNDYSHDGPAVILSAVGARCGKTFKADGKWGVVANTYCLFAGHNLDRNFFWYLTNIENWWEKGGSAQPFVKVKDTLSRPWCFPQLPEQIAIAEFLDRETAKIDALIEEQKRLIELLKEKRQAVISHAVTKGLNPSAKMKDSGIEWLGEVPEHWEVVQVKRISSLITSGPRGWSDMIAEDGAIFFQSQNIGRQLELILENASRLNPEDNAESQRARLKYDDIVVCITGARTSSVAHVNIETDDAFINQHVCLVRPDKCVGRFLAYSLFANNGQKQMQLAMYGLKQGLSLEDIRTLWVPVPPFEEAHEIIEKIDREMKDFSALETNAESAINLLQERRSALISAAVTGKIDIRNYEMNGEAA